MAAASDPFESYLRRAVELFEAGDIVQAGQIWQAILKKRPDHEIARAGLYKVKLYFDARATQGGLVTQKSTGQAVDVRATQGGPAGVQDPELVRLLEQGCTLYDAGHVEEALARWVQVLAKEPDNVLAKGYIEGARRTLVQPLPEKEATAATRAPVPTDEPGVDAERLLRDGCTLFDMGQLEDALKKWEQILAQDPWHALARAYVQDARKDLGLPPLEEGVRPVSNPAKPAAAEPAMVAEDERLDRLIRDGVQLYDMGMIQEATQKWQLVLDLAPGHKDAEAYLAMARQDLAVPATKPVPAPPAVEFSGRDFPGLQPRLPKSAPPPAAPLELAFEEPAAAAQPAAPVTPPPALTSGAQKVRKGLNLPELLQSISLPGWMASPAFILGTIAGLVILLFGTFYFLKYRKDEALKRTVASFKANAVSPVARNSKIADLQQTPEEIRREAQAALGDDSLLAYLRAKELLRLNPGDAAASQLLDHAKAELAKEASPSAIIGDFEKQLRNGDLESADRTMMALLSVSPDDRILQERAIRLYGAMVQAYASKEQWTEAETCLHRGRAMFPEDKSWSVKLLLLARIQTLPRSERAPWIQLLG
jgi:tetratricopeptide (TPR) repeat protein